MATSQESLLLGFFICLVGWLVYRFDFVFVLSGGFCLVWFCRLGYCLLLGVGEDLTDLEPTL